MRNSFQIDSLDRKILSILIRDARIPFLEVARECGVSGAAIHQRVQRLKRLRIISGSQFNLDPKRLGFNTCAYIGIYLENAGIFEEVMAKLEKIPEIVQCHYTTGQYALFIKVFAYDNEHLRKILVNKIQNIRGISRTETFISLDMLIDRQVPVEDD